MVYQVIPYWDIVSEFVFFPGHFLENNPAEIWHICGEKTDHVEECYRSQYNTHDPFNGSVVCCSK